MEDRARALCAQVDRKTAELDAVAAGADAEAAAAQAKAQELASALSSLRLQGRATAEAFEKEAREAAVQHEEELAARGAEFARVSDAQLQSLSAAEETVRTLRATLVAAEQRRVEQDARARALEARIEVLTGALESRSEEVLLGERAQAQLEASLTNVILDCYLPLQQRQQQQQPWQQKQGLFSGEESTKPSGRGSGLGVISEVLGSSYRG